MLSNEKILQYTKLAGRRLQIIMNSGIHWRPEYADELGKINVELAKLRLEVDAAYKKGVHRAADKNNR